MGDDAKPWDICDDCLDPFAKKLLAFVKRFRPVFDQAEAIRLETQGQQPPRPDDLRELCYEFDVDRAVVQLQATFSLDFASEFTRMLRAVDERFRTLDSKANQRLDRYAGKYATPLLIGRYLIAVDKLPAGDELPHDLRKIEAEIVKEYMNVADEFELVSKYLSNVSTEVRRKSMPTPVAATKKQKRSTDTKTDALYEVFSIYTDGSSDDRFKEMARIVSNDDLTLDEKLWAIHKLIPIPSSMSAEKLGRAFGVTKAAIQKTSWYKECRKGEQTKEVSRRWENHVKRGIERKDLPRKTGTQYKSEDWDK